MKRRPLRRAVALFVVLSALVAGVTTLGVSLVVDEIVRGDVRAEAERTARLMQIAVMTSLEQDPDIDAERHFDDVLRSHVESGTLQRVKVWKVVQDSRLRLVYSDLADIVGQEKPLAPSRASLLGTDGTLVLAVPDDAAHVTESALVGETVEVFTAFDSGSEEFLLESYFATGSEEQAARLRSHLLPVLAGGMIVLTTAAAPLAIALGRRLNEAEAESTRTAREREDERIRLGQRLHDGVVQDLAGASLALSALARQDRSDPARVEAIAGTLRADILLLRALLEDLVPAEVAWSDLSVRLEQIARAAGLPGAAVHVHESPEADPEVTRILCGLARELLLNAARHGEADTVVVTARVVSGQAWLEVVDDGRGFDRREPGDGHVGLRIVEQVVRKAAGSVEISSAPGEGARVTICIPVTGRP